MAVKLATDTSTSSVHRFSQIKYNFTKAVFVLFISLYFSGFRK